MKIFISADIEGVAGVVSWDQTLREGRGYAQACQWMTDEVRVACEVALEFGASRIIVADSHLTRENIDIDKLPKVVETVRGGPRPNGMVHGIESDEFDVLLCIGYHAGSHENGILNHTCNGAGFHEIRINGAPVDELDIYARVAGQFGTPLGLVTGDDVICASVGERFPETETAVLKTRIGRMAGHCLSPATAHELIAVRTRAALQKARKLAPITLDGPIDVEIDFKWHHPVEVLCLLRSFEARGAQTIGFIADDMAEVARAIEFLGSYKLVPYP
ncbi:MAG: M55 family metallopeptidase [Pseudomonadota bacterium]